MWWLSRKIFAWPSACLAFGLRTNSTLRSVEWNGVHRRQQHDLQSVDGPLRCTATLLLESVVNSRTAIIIAAAPRCGAPGYCGCAAAISYDVYTWAHMFFLSQTLSWVRSRPTKETKKLLSLRPSLSWRLALAFAHHAASKERHEDLSGLPWTSGTSKLEPHAWR